MCSAIFINNEYKKGRGDSGIFFAHIRVLMAFSSSFSRITETYKEKLQPVEKETSVLNNPFFADANYNDAYSTSHYIYAVSLYSHVLQAKKNHHYG